MRHVRSFVAALITFASLATAAYSQINYNTIDMGAMMRNTQNNIINGARNRILAGGSVEEQAMRAEFERISKIGAAKIKAGRATTKFTNSPNATELLAKNVSWESTAPQNLQGQVRFIQHYVKQFEMLMTQNGFAQNDFADGIVFAYALSYAALNNKDMNKGQLEQMRIEQQRAILNAAYFQGVVGTNDQPIQGRYEMNATMAMQAAEQRAFARRATSEIERQKYEDKAQYFAKFVLDEMKQ